MRLMHRPLYRIGAFVVCLLSWPLSAPAWDYAAHRIINQLGLAALPTNYPAFVRAAAATERIAFLSGEPDRWRNTPDLTFRHRNGPDHFLDVDDLPQFLLAPTDLSPFRYDFVAQLVRGRDAHPTNFPPVDSRRDLDHTRALIGFLPWTVSEYYSELKSACSYLKTFERAGGTPAEVANAQQNIIYLMGVMGHFVGDSTQPLHTTKHYNGWLGANPKQYTTNRAFHAWIDGGYIQKAALTTDSLVNGVVPARPLSDGESKSTATNIFPTALNFLLAQSKLVEPLYHLEQEGALSIEGPPTAKGTEFMGSQLTKAAQMLADLWLTAWTEAPGDRFLAEELARRKATETKTGPTTRDTK